MVLGIEEILEIMIKNARAVLSEHIKVHYDEEEKITAAMKAYAAQVVENIDFRRLGYSGDECEEIENAIKNNLV